MADTVIFDPERRSAQAELACERHARLSYACFSPTPLMVFWCSEVPMAGQTNFADPRSFLAMLPFVRELGIIVVSAAPGEVIVEMPFADRFSTPPNQFPASIVGVIGDVAAASSCISRLPSGWAGATLDYTAKMTGRAQGEKLVARGRVLQAGQTISVGASDVFVVTGNREIQCGVVLATTRNFEIKPGRA